MRLAAKRAASAKATAEQPAFCIQHATHVRMAHILILLPRNDIRPVPNRTASCALLPQYQQIIPTQCFDTPDVFLFLSFTKQNTTRAAPGCPHSSHCAAHPHPFLLPAFGCSAQAWDDQRLLCHSGHSDDRANVCLSLFINSVCSKLYNYENNKTTAGSPGIFTISPCCSEVSLCCCTDWLCLVPQDV